MVMTTTRLTLWYRYSWWVPGMCSAFAVMLILATLRPDEQSLLLAVAILCALPWSLALLVLDLGQGFADRAAVIVTVGLVANVALLWWATALLRARYRRRRSPRRHAFEA